MGCAEDAPRFSAWPDGADTVAGRGRVDCTVSAVAAAPHPLPSDLVGMLSTFHSFMQNPNLDALKQKYGRTREEREAIAKTLMFTAGAKGCVGLGTAGLVAHWLMQKQCTCARTHEAAGSFYQRHMHYQIKAFITTSWFVAGYWIFSEVSDELPGCWCADTVSTARE